jgi:hypothetical protein
MSEINPTVPDSSTSPVAPVAAEVVTPTGPAVTNVYVNQAHLPALPPLSIGVAYLLWFLLGIFGGHKFYVGKTGMGILYLFTAGIFLIGWFIDVFTLGAQVNAANARRAVGIR